MRLYHITPTANVFNILEEGLRPAIGLRSEELGEDVARIYVFKDALAMEDALSNWLGEAFDYDEALSIIELEVDDARVVIPDDMYEAYILETVAPSAIVRIVSELEWELSSESSPSVTPREEGLHP